MRRSKMAILLTLPLAFAACTADDEIEEVPALEEPVASPQVEAPVTPMGATTPTSEVQPLNDSGIAGEITARAEGSATAINATFTGFDGNAEVVGHVHRGTCETIATALESLAEFGPIEVGSDGIFATSIDVPITDLQSDRYAIGFHLGGTTQHIACADFDATTM